LRHCISRTDPAVIMLIHDGDRIILRQSQWPPGILPPVLLSR
jgi:NADH pyrophosphatase NudC (nudix superfamily)